MSKSVFHQPPNMFVSQVALKVQNLERSLFFYQQVLGLRVLQQAEKQAVLTADGVTPLLVIEQPEGVLPKQPRTAGLYHFALLLPSRRDLAKLLRHFIAVGYPLQGASDHLVSEAIYLADPDGNGIEVYTDRPAEQWNWRGSEVEMATKALDAESLFAEDDGEAWNGIAPQTIMGHIHLHVSNLQEAEAFYTKALGFDVVCHYPQALFISTGKYHHHIGLNTWNGVGAPAPHEASVGMKSFTLVFPSEEEKSKAVERLTQFGAAVPAEGEVLDLAGNRIVLVSQA